MVKTENSYGMSVPSGTSNVVRTSATSNTTEHLLDNARSKLSNKVLILRDLFPLSSTSVQVVWDVSSNKYIIILLTVYRATQCLCPEVLCLFQTTYYILSYLSCENIHVIKGKIVLTKLLRAGSFHFLNFTLFSCFFCKYE